MSPSDPLVDAANNALKNPDVRASIRQMHKQGYPLIKMVEDLGLEDDMSAQLRQIILDLPDDVVAEIRQATLEMLDEADKAAGIYAMPLECLVNEAQIESGTPVNVEVKSVDGRQTIRVQIPGKS